MSWPFNQSIDYHVTSIGTIVLEIGFAARFVNQVVDCISRWWWARLVRDTVPYHVLQIKALLNNSRLKTICRMSNSNHLEDSEDCELPLNEAHFRVTAESG